MAFYTTSPNRREHFSAPQFTRTNHRYRGQRESEKINLELSQLYFSIRKLYEGVGNLQDDLLNAMDLLIDGNDLFSLEETPYYEMLEGLSNLVARTSLLEARLRSVRRASS